MVDDLAERMAAVESGAVALKDELAELGISRSTWYKLKKQWVESA